MKKILGVIVLGLLLSGNAYAEVMKFECTQPDNKKLKYIKYKIDLDNSKASSEWVFKGKFETDTYIIKSKDSEKVELISKRWPEQHWYFYYATNQNGVDVNNSWTSIQNCKKINSASTDSKSVGISFTIKDKKEQCAAIGFKPATDKFADCVLRLVELDLQKQISNPTIVAQDSGNQAIVDELKRSNNMQQSQFLMNLSNQLLNPSSPASSMSSSSCTVRGGTIKTINCW